VRARARKVITGNIVSPAARGWRVGSANSSAPGAAFTIPAVNPDIHQPIEHTPMNKKTRVVEKKHRKKIARIKARKRESLAQAKKK
jgi:hypothetical protein